MWRRWQERTEAFHLDGFAMSLGVDTDALRSLGAAWTGQAWAFPMRDAEGRVIGIRLRGQDGRKWAVKGSRAGMFYGEGEAVRDVLFIVEGPTDAAAALTLGLPVVGRPSCSGSEEMLAAYVRRARVRRVVIVADADEPGLRGAERLRASLPVLSCLTTLPAKDMRDFVRLGGTRKLLDSILKDLVWGKGAQV